VNHYLSSVLYGYLADYVFRHHKRKLASMGMTKNQSKSRYISNWLASSMAVRCLIDVRVGVA
jgi:hypothetical protein